MHQPSTSIGLIKRPFAQAHPLQDGADVICRAPTAVFHQLEHLATAPSSTPTNNAPLICSLERLPGGGVAVDTVSEMGVHKRAHYRVPKDVAVALVACVEDAPRALRASFCEFRTGARAEVLLLTWRRWDSQRAAGARRSPARLSRRTYPRDCPLDEVTLYIRDVAVRCRVSPVSTVRQLLRWRARPAHTPAGQARAALRCRRGGGARRQAADHRLHPFAGGAVARCGHPKRWQRARTHSGCAAHRLIPCADRKPPPVGGKQRPQPL